MGLSFAAPLAGRDVSGRHGDRRDRHFNPRTPCGVRRQGILNRAARRGNFNPRTPCGVRLPCCIERKMSLSISIHAPLAGCDHNSKSRKTRRRYFNPRTPCGVRRAGARTGSSATIFQSTRPLRGATSLPSLQIRARPSFQSTRPLRGATCSGHAGISLVALISIHAPLAGRDSAGLIFRLSLPSFQSTRPLRGATGDHAQHLHAPHYFNPRAPCGARLYAPVASAQRKKFQSTRPLRGATRIFCENAYACCISIHAPLAGRDYDRREDHSSA